MSINERLGRKRLRKHASALGWDLSSMHEWVQAGLARIAGAEEDEPAQFVEQATTDEHLEFEMLCLCLDLTRAMGRHSVYVARSTADAKRFIEQSKVYGIDTALLRDEDKGIGRYDRKEAVGVWVPIHAGEFDQRKSHWFGEKPDAVGFIHSNRPGHGLMDCRYAAHVTAAICQHEDDYEYFWELAQGTDKQGVLQPKSRKKLVSQLESRYFSVVTSTVPQWRAIRSLPKLRISLPPESHKGLGFRIAPAQPEFLYSRPEFAYVDRALVLDATAQSSL